MLLGSKRRDVDKETIVGSVLVLGLVARLYRTTHNGGGQQARHAQRGAVPCLSQVGARDHARYVLVHGVHYVHTQCLVHVQNARLPFPGSLHRYIYIRSLLTILSE